MDTKDRDAAFAAFEAADDAWHQLLILSFGAGACLARYEDRGKGRADTPLRAAYEAREAARQVWEARL